MPRISPYIFSTNRELTHRFILTFRPFVWAVSIKWLHSPPLNILFCTSWGIPLTAELLSCYRSWEKRRYCLQRCIHWWAHQVLKDNSKPTVIQSRVKSMGNKAKTIVKGCKGEIRRKEWGETGEDGDGWGWGVGVIIIHYVHSEGVVKEQTKLIKKEKMPERAKHQGESVLCF